MITIEDICKTFRKRADTWEREQVELGKIVAYEIRGIVDVFEEEFENERLRNALVPVPKRKALVKLKETLK
jgi:hypothetical protein